MDEFDDNEIARLLRLKRYEQPPPGYFEDFLHEFHRRHRDELLRQPLWQIALQRAQDLFVSFNLARLASYPAAAAAVLVCAAVISLKIYQAPQQPAGFAHAAPAYATPVSAQTAEDQSWNLNDGVERMARVATVQPRVRHSNLSTHRTAAPPRYVLDSMPVSYESTLRF